MKTGKDFVKLQNRNDNGEASLVLDVRHNLFETCYISVTVSISIWLFRENLPST